MFLKYITFILLIFLAMESTAAGESSTTTVTVTPTVTATVTVAYLEDIYETVYEYTNSLSKSTATTVTGSTHIGIFTPLSPVQDAVSPTSTASIGNLSGASLSTQPLSVPTLIPLGEYSTSEYTKTTTIEDGSSAVIDTPQLKYGLRLSGYTRGYTAGKLGSMLNPGFSNYKPNVGNQIRTVKTLTIDWNPIKTSKTNLTLVERQQKTPYLRKFVMGLMIAMPVISFFLGCWQVRRLEWKMDLIAKGENALAQPPIEKLPPNLDPEAVKDFEYRRFRVKGHFDYDQEMFLGVRMRDGTPGYLVVCPFIRSDGGRPILIERGWISKDKVIPDSRTGGPLEYMARPQGEIEIEAMFRIMPKKSSLQYEHEKGNRLFHVPDVEAMAEQSGSLPIYCQMLYDMSDKPEWKHKEQKSSLMDKIPFLRKGNSESKDYLDFKNDNDATLEHQELEFINEGVPIGTLPKVKYTNNHLQYLVTWFSLSAASTILLVYNIIKKRKYLSAEKVIEEKRKNMKQMW